ncbi:ferric siderophore transport system, periplasmic binding protein TonB [Helicobacter bizzozeronii CIII-1]|uniref:Ferric siderophore transport system, periplasmic binding protein TonB n=7 Tax=Helicobacter bizzozeronii TaxID=56877 RepID=F8KP78_HELBC|nr:TonB family protein [Helicobacter bizzozeronii]CCB80584.1 ferric siderophore transport system, periplasmic binding protein TonB [Helicobacter bizzozeronii CIII-1]
MPRRGRITPAVLEEALRSRRSDRNFYISLLLSCLLHLLLWWLFQYGREFFAHKPKLVKVNPSNLLVLKRGRSLDPTKHTPGAKRLSRAAPKAVPLPHPQTRPTPPPTPHRPKHKVKPQKVQPKSIEPKHEHIASHETHHKALQQEQKEVVKKAPLETPKQVPQKTPEPKHAPQHKAQKAPTDDFNPNNLSFLPSEQTPQPQPNHARRQSYEEDKGMDSQTRKDIDELYGEEFGDLGTAEKDFIRSNLSEIGRITQKYLEYPSAAGYLGQDGVDAVEFYLHPNGDITGLKIILPSGYKLLDDNTLKTITIAYKDYPRPTTTTLIRIRVRYFIYR